MPINHRPPVLYLADPYTPTPDIKETVSEPWVQAFDWPLTADFEARQDNNFDLPDDDTLKSPRLYRRPEAQVMLNVRLEYEEIIRYSETWFEYLELATVAAWQKVREKMQDLNDLGLAGHCIGVVSRTLLGDGVPCQIYLPRAVVYAAEFSIESHRPGNAKHVARLTLGKVSAPWDAGSPAHLQIIPHKEESHGV